MTGTRPPMAPGRPGGRGGARGGGTVIGPALGEPGPWLAFVGTHDEVDRSSTLLFLEDPDAPCRWFVRSLPFPVVNPSLAFDKQLVLTPGGTLSRRYRIVVGT